MAQTDNTLGAPTEGLGQTVTFASQGQVGVPQQQAGQRGSVRNDLQNGGFRANGPAQFIQPAPDPTLALLQKMGTEILAPHIEQAQQEQYVKGMQQVAQGQAIGDIVDEQPWYSKIFGSTSVVDGARAFSAHSAAQKEVLAVSEMMPEFRKQSPEQAQATFSKRLTAIKTGDPTTDAMAVQSLSKELPGLMRMQAKEHIVWTKAEFARSRADAIDAGANVIQSIAGKPQGAGRSAKDMLEGNEGGVGTDGDKSLAEFNFAQSMAKPVSMTPEDYDKATAPVVMKMLMQGKLHAYNVFKNSGLASQLSEQSQIRLENAEVRAEHRARNNMTPELIQRYAALRSDADQANTPEKLVAWGTNAAAFNSDFRRNTGSSENAIGSAEEVSSRQKILNSIADADARRLRDAKDEMERAREDTAKAAALDAFRETGLGIMMTGGSPNVYKAQEVNDMFAMAGARGVAPQLAVQAYKHGYVNKTMSGRLTQELDVVGGDAVAFNKMYNDKWLPLLSNTLDGKTDFRAATEYFNGNPQHAKSMAMYHSLVAGRNLSPADQGAAHALSIAAQPRSIKVDSKGNPTGDDAVYTKTINEWSTGWLTGKTSLLNFNDDLVKGEQTNLLRLAIPIVDAMGDNIPADQRMQVALSTLEKQGMAMIGGRFIVAPQGEQNIKSFVEKLRDPDGIRPAIASDEIDQAFRSTLDRKSSALGLGRIQVTQKTLNGKPNLLVLGHDKDNKFQAFSITPEEIVAEQAKNKPADVNVVNARLAELQTAGVARKGMGLDKNAGLSPQPSAYDSEDTWIAWRKQHPVLPKP